MDGGHGFADLRGGKGKEPEKWLGWAISIEPRRKELILVSVR
jgi:hypothetical protein